MLHLFIGIDGAAAKAAARKHTKGEVVFFGEGCNNFDIALSYVHSQGLFTPHVSLVFDHALDSSEGKELLTSYAEFLHTSDTDVFVIETTLNAEAKKLFPKSATVTEFGKKEVRERPMPFAMSDAFLKGDRKSAWIEFQKLIMDGVQAEEIHGTLSWAVRSALVAAKTKSPDEARLKPFVYTKSRRAAEKRGVGKVENLSRELVRIYHNARAGGADMALAIEKLLLEKA